MQDKKRIVSFVDSEDIKWEIELEITHRNDYPEFTISGKGNGRVGQIVDSISPDNEYQENLLDMWDEYHLTNIEKAPFNDFWIAVEELVESIEEEEKEKFPSKLIEDCNTEELETFDDAITALGLHLELTIEELENIETIPWGYGNCSYEVHGESYYSGDEEDITKAVKEYVENTLWAFNTSFLSDYGALDNINYANVEDILKPLREQCESGNEAIKALVDWDNNGDQITEDAIVADGVGHFLNGYDGTSDEYIVNGVEYTVCQQ